MLRTHLRRSIREMPFKLTLQQFTTNSMLIYTVHMREQSIFIFIRVCENREVNG